MEGISTSNTSAPSENRVSQVSDPAGTDQSRIIFVNPEDWVAQQLVGILVRAEYRSVILRDPALLPGILESHKNSIIFFNIDRQPEGLSWFSLVREHESRFERSRTLPVFLGKAPRESIKARVKLSIPYDAFDMGRSPKQVLVLIRALLDQWYQKGQRRYIRVSCPANGRNRFNLRLEGDHWEGEILDISSAGMACRFVSGPVPRGLVKGRVLNNIQLKLNSRLVMVDAVVMGHRGSPEEPGIYVLLFRNHHDSGSEQKIKDYVRERLQEEFLAEHLPAQ